MKTSNIVRRFGAVALAAAFTVLFGCAQRYAVSPAPDDQQEEIVVTGTRSESPRTTRARAGETRPLRAAVRADAPGASDALPYVADDELWIIAKPEASESRADADGPGTGSMVARYERQEVPLPLQHTDVTATIDGYISSVEVSQQFRNPYDGKIEAVYLFPLPEKAAITEFLMVIGERRIRGILREKEEAQRIYETARSQGYRASLMVQHRPNVFEQKVANIEPRESIDVDIKYFHTLKYKDGWYSFVFPTVVGPRFNPPESTDPIGAVPRTDTGTSSPAVRYLRPDERSGHDIGIEVNIDAGVDIEEVRSTHEILAQRPEPGSASVRLANNSTIPNRDFVLEFRVAGETMKSNLMTYVDPDSQEGFFTLMLYPPEATDGLQRKKMEMVFVIDASGSMSGRPIEQAKEAVSAALDNLQEGDTFQIIRFSDTASQFGAEPVPATRRNIEQARRYLRNLSGGGGTYMIEGIRAALGFRHDPSRLRFVSFLTDGYIGNEADILREIERNIGASRVFSFGVGSSVNRYLMERMAGVGRGAVAYLGPQDSGYEIMADFFNRISHPALTDVEIDWGSMAVSDVYPSRLPDLFVGRSVVVTGKFVGTTESVSVLGRSGTREHRQRIANDGPSVPQLAKIWARLRIAELEDRRSWATGGHEELANSIRDTALRYQLMSDYTSFVAVDSSERTEGEHGTTVHQAVPVPDGVRYDTTVNEQ